MLDSDLPYKISMYNMKKCVPNCSKTNILVFKKLSLEVRRLYFLVLARNRPLLANLAEKIVFIGKQSLYLKLFSQKMPKISKIPKIQLAKLLTNK